MALRTLLLLLALAPALACATLSTSPDRGARPPDWLVHPPAGRAEVLRSPDGRELRLENGLVRRTFRLAPDAATVGLDELTTGLTLLRGVKPEALLTIDGEEYAVGGLLGQEEYGYLRWKWLDGMTRDPRAFRFVEAEVGPTEAPFEWKRTRPSQGAPWPPPGVHLTLRFSAPEGLPAVAGLAVEVHYELYDGLPVFTKWIELVHGGERTITLDGFVAERLAIVEHGADVEDPGHWDPPGLHVESDYAFSGFTPRSANQVVHWLPDPQYSSQVNYARKTPAMLECRPPLGPGLELAPGERFESFRVLELLHDSTDRERQGLALRRTYRALAPWVTENPTLMHVRRSEPEAVRLAVDQCAEVGFEMLILSFGSGFSMENEDPAYVAQIRDLVDYAHSKGVQLGGYSLFSSRRISDEQDVIDPETGRPGGAKFGNAPCLGSAWGQEYMRKLRSFIERTGLDVLEHDGPYPGDVCGSTTHPGHRGLADSQWNQWRTARDFYRWCRGRGVYLNVPDWYFLSGTNKTGMGYRETNWSLPRERQLVLGRQNVHDGTWQKTPSMGWMFVPLVEYHGGGAAATLEPLDEHLDDYSAHLAQNFGFGVQACYRGPRLYDSERTREVVAGWVEFFLEHRSVLEADVIHLRRADGRDWDGLLHVDPGGDPAALAMFFNPLDEAVERTIELPLYYAGLHGEVRVRERGGDPRRFELDRRWRVRVPVRIEARSSTWLTVEAPGAD